MTVVSILTIRWASIPLPRKYSNTRTVWLSDIEIENERRSGLWRGAACEEIECSFEATG